MRSLRAFLLGVAATTVLAYATSATLGVAAHVSGSDMTIALGRVTFVEVRESPGLETFLVGPGVALAGLAGGVVNVLAAATVRRRSR